MTLSQKIKIFQIITQRKRNKVQFNCTCADFTFQALLDAGAVCSFIDNILADKMLAEGGRLEDVTAIAILADGTESNIRHLRCSYGK